MPSIRRLRRRLPGRSLHHQRNPRCGSKRPLDVRRAGTTTSSLAISRDASSGISRLASAARCGQCCVHQNTAGQSLWRFLIGRDIQRDRRVADCMPGSEPTDESPGVIAPLFSSHYQQPSAHDAIVVRICSEASPSKQDLIFPDCRDPERDGVIIDVAPMSIRSALQARSSPRYSPFAVRPLLAYGCRLFRS
jgi:hypothetical protein